MAGSARVVVIGGGIMGVSLLYHLAKEGWTDALLVEKGELTSGSTWHAAGQVTHGLAHRGLGRINAYGVRLYRGLEAETGQSVSWHGCGSMRLAYLDDEVNFVKYTLSVGRGLGEPMELIPPEEAAKLHPFFNFKGVKAVLHTPEDGHVDPSGAAFALAKGARDAGARIRRFTRCTGVERRPGGEWKVETDQGDIFCEHVVNAAGAYARQVAAWVGYALPMANTTHHYFVTEPVEEFKALEKELPIIRDDMTYSGYIRMEQTSGLIGIYEKINPRTVWDDGVPWEAEHELFAPDYDRIMPFLEKALERMPLLARYGIRRGVHGAIPMPPDGQMLLGPAPGLTNYWCCCGSHVGIAWGPGAGRYLAQWMVHGTAEISMRDFDPRRFGPWVDRKYEIERAKEEYVLRHEIPYPGRQRTVGRPRRTSPLFERLKQAGAIHEEVYGWERPRWFALPDQTRRDLYGWRRPGWQRAVADECRAVRERVGIMDLSAFGKIDVSGPGARDFLERMVANRVPRAKGGLALTHILNERGTIEAEGVVSCIEDERFYLVFAAFFEQKVRDWLTQHRRADEEAVIEVVSEQFGCLALSGPKSRAVLRRATQTPLGNARFPWFSARTITVAGVEGVRALRLSYQGELGWELHVPMIGMEVVYEALWRAGEPHGIANFGSCALNALRLEKGFKGASELTNEVTLPEAGVMRFCRPDKGEFIGREATLESLRQEESGEMPWVCVQVEVEAGDADAHASETVYYQSDHVGQVSSGGFGFACGKSLAFCYVHPRVAAPGTELEILVLGERRKATVLDGPVYDAANERPRVEG